MMKNNILNQYCKATRRRKGISDNSADCQHICIDRKTLPTDKIQQETNKMQDNLKLPFNLKGHQQQAC